MAVQKFNRHHLAIQSFQMRKVGIDGGEGDAADTIVGSAPYQAVTIIGDEVDVVGTQAVIFRNAEQLLSAGIGEDDAVALGGQCLETVFQLLALIDV